MNKPIIVTMREMGVALSHACFSYSSERIHTFTDEELQKIWFDRFGIILRIEKEYPQEIKFEFKDKEQYVMFMLEWS
jgi:hypothetical protein